MTVRQDPPADLLPLVAPLTEPLAFHLARPYIQDLPEALHPKGRPSNKEGGAIGRKQRLLHLALAHLIPRIAAEREQVYTLLNPVVQAGELTRKWLLHELEKYIPGEALAYPDRLREWRRANILLFDEKNQPEPQSTAALLLMRRLDKREKRGWLPRHLQAPQSYFCWRQDTSQLGAVPYALPLLPVHQSTSSILRPVLEKGAAPALLWTPWKGGVWDDTDAWLLTDEGAIRWLGEPTPEQMTHWLTSRQLAGIANNNASSADMAKLALPLLAADRLLLHRDLQ